MPSERPRILLVVRCCVRREDGRFLIIQRASSDSYMPGAWEFPGGKLEDGEHATQAMVNEVEQETGLKLEGSLSIAHVESFVVPTDTSFPQYAGLPYVSLVGTGLVTNPSVVLSNEHDDFAWVNHEEALGYPLKKGMPEILAALRQHELIT